MDDAPQDGGRHGPGNRLAAGAIDGDMLTCWFCRRPVSQRALFCHQCGSLQPPAPLDAFARLGLPRRFEVDPDALDRQLAGFTRPLDSERVRSRGPKEQALAQRHRDALAAAHEALRDPVARGRLLLELEGRPPAAAALDEPDPLWTALEAAGDAAAVDRVAAEVGRETETAVRGLAAAFRAGNLDRASALIARAERLRHLAELARRRRAALGQG